jgi:Lamin Tail Domain/Bacterial TSP3 repeat
MRQQFLVRLAALLVLLSSLPLTHGQAVRINEILSDNTLYPNVFGGYSDMVELFNTTASDVAIAGWSLSDSNAFPLRYVFPPGTPELLAGEYRVIAFDSAFTNSPYTDNPGEAVPFGIKSTGGFLFLFDPAQTVIDQVEYGLQLPNHSIVRTSPTVWRLGTPSLGAANTTLALGTAFALRINEWLANPSSGDDYFEIYNRTNKPVALGGLYLTDTSSIPMQYTIAPLSFIGTGGLAYVTFAANSKGGTTGTTNRYPANQVNFGLSSGGESIILYTNFQEIHRVVFGAQDSGISEGYLPDGNTNNVVRFPKINDYDTKSPGDPNFLILTNIFVNELLSHTDPPQEDVVEFLNRTGTNVNISGWWLSNERSVPRKYLIPTNSIVPAFGYKTIYEGFGTSVGFNSSSAAAPFTFNSARGDNIILSQTDTNGNLTGHRVYETFESAANGISFGYYKTSVPRDYKFVATAQTTFGADEANTVAEFRTGTGKTNTYPKIGPLVINEIMAAPADSIYYPIINGTNSTIPAFGQSPADEFIELRNVTSLPVLLYDPAFPTNHWKLQKAVNFTFPLTNLAANSFCLVVGFSPSNASALAIFRNRYHVSNNVPIFGPWEGRLNDSGDSLELYKPDPVQLPPHPDAGYVPFVRVDKVNYGANYQGDPTNYWPSAIGGASLQRRNSLAFGNDPINWAAATPTAGAPSSSALTDTDGDGIPDAWEVQYGFNPTNSADAALDPDNDTTSNLAEYVAGTNPTNSLSVLRILGVTPSPDNEQPAYVHFFAYSNATYTVEYRKKVDSNWKKVADVPALPLNRLVNVPDQGATNSASSLTNTVSDRYYRVVAPATN